MRAHVVVCRFFLLFSILLSVGTVLRADDDFVHATPKQGEPTDLKARKAYASALDWERHRMDDAAISDYRKANKLDGGRCAQCMMRAYRLAMRLGAFTSAVDMAREGLLAAGNDKDRAGLHYMLGNALYEEGAHAKKQAKFVESREELKAALGLNPEIAQAHYVLGMDLAHLQQDDEARTEFQAFLDQDRKSPSLHERVERYLERIDLARARMAPPFSVTTLDGQRISMDGLAGKVVLIDFWAMWCAPCRNALPHIQQLARKYEGRPLVVLSVSLDADEAKWKEFVEKNKMTWLQYRDGGFGGKIAKLFSVTAIPATFSIDSDGVLEDQHVGDADIDGKLKKMVVQAEKLRVLGNASASNAITPVSKESTAVR